VKSLVVVFVLLLVVAGFYRSFGSAETGTGTLTLPQPAPTVGERAPTFTAESMGGEPFTLSDEGIYVLTFWSTLNVGSDEAQPGFARLAEEYEGDGVSFAAVYVNSSPSDGDAPYAVLQDPSGRLTSRYNVKHVPRLFLVKDGDIEMVLNSYYEGYDEDLEEVLNDALANGDGS
jgi:thiol-disulfide isomerase/thioredoxin